MTLVDLNRLPDHGPATAPPEGMSLPDMRAYDEKWGFFTFGQSIETRYTEADVYRSTGSFTITGVFTAGGEGQDVDPRDYWGGGSWIESFQLQEKTTFESVVARYESLQLLFKEAGVALAPEDPASWGGPNDPRLIILPSPLVDAHNKPVFARPTSLGIAGTQFSSFIQYEARLVEPNRDAGVLIINDIAVEEASLDIDPAHPDVFRHRMVAGNGSLVNVKNYRPTRVRVSMSIPMAEDEGMVSTRAMKLIKTLDDGKFDVEMFLPENDERIVLFSKLRVSEPPQVSHDSPDGRTTIFITGVM